MSKKVTAHSQQSAKLGTLSFNNPDPMFKVEGRQVKENTHNQRNKKKTRTHAHKLNIVIGEGGLAVALTHTTSKRYLSFAECSSSSLGALFLDEKKLQVLTRERLIADLRGERSPMHCSRAIKGVCTSIST